MGTEAFLIDRDHQPSGMSGTGFGACQVLTGICENSGVMIFRKMYSRPVKPCGFSLFTTSRDHVLTTKPEIPVTDCRDGVSDNDLRRKKADKTAKKRSMHSLTTTSALKSQ